MPPNSIFSAAQVNTVEVRGLIEAQRKLADVQKTVDPRRGLRDLVTLAIGQLHRFASSIVHVQTGRLKNSLFWQVSPRGNSVIGYVRTNVEYAAAEHGRGGSHAFFDRTVREEGPNVNSLFADRVSISVNR